MPATVIAERIGWRRGMTILRDRVAELRPLFVEPDPYQGTTYQPGELAPWDIWFPGTSIPLGYGHTGDLPVLVGVAGFSRVMVGHMISSRESCDLLAGHLICLVDLAAMLSLSSVLPDVSHRFSTRIGRDYYVRFSTCDYSAHPKAIGRRVDIELDLDWVAVALPGEEVARHGRSLAPHRTITDAAHARARRLLRESPDDAHREVEVDVEVRDLADSDRALGVM